MSFILSGMTTVGVNQQPLGLRIAPNSSLPSYLIDAVCCRVHLTVREVCGGGEKQLPGHVGYHPAILAAEMGVTRVCHADGTILRLDKELAKAALDFSIPGFAYCTRGGLQKARRWEKGSVIGMAAFGKGYCYLVIIQVHVRMRVARILGPCPLVCDVWLMFRLVGVFSACVSFRGVSPGLMHIEEGGTAKSGREIAAELMGIVELSSEMRVGHPGDELLDIRSEGARGRCDKCGFGNILLEGHESRCVVQPRRDSAAELVGDALHAYDVKEYVVHSYPRGSKYTLLAKPFIEAVGQAQYMQMRWPGVLSENASVRAWSNEFETRYYVSPTFRTEYLRWLHKQLPDCDLQYKVPIREHVEDALSWLMHVVTVGFVVVVMVSFAVSMVYSWFGECGANPYI